MTYTVFDHVKARNEDSGNSNVIKLVSIGKNGNKIPYKNKIVKKVQLRVLTRTGKELLISIKHLNSKFQFKIYIQNLNRNLN